MLKPHDLRHGVAMEVYEQHHDLEDALLGHTRIETTQCYARIRPPQRGLRNIRIFLKPGSKNLKNNNMVVPTGFEPVFKP
jgi:integrase